MVRESQYSLEKHLAMAIFMGRWREGFLGMFTGYFDASGSPDDPQTAAVVVAGFVATAEQWIEFERNWKDTLRRFQVSALHMKLFAHSVGEYESWKGDEGKRRRFLSALISIIRVRVRHSFASAVILDAYRRLNQKYYLEECVKPYSIAGNALIARVKHWADRRSISRDQIAYFFEDGDADKGNFIDRCALTHGFTPMFLPKNRSVAFQAADLLAYEQLLANTKVHRSGPNIVALDELRYPFRELESLSRDRQDWGVQDEVMLEKNCKEGGLPLRIPGVTFEQAIAAIHGI